MRSAVVLLASRGKSSSSTAAILASAMLALSAGRGCANEPRPQEPASVADSYQVASQVAPTRVSPLAEMAPQTGPGVLEHWVDQQQPSWRRCAAQEEPRPNGKVVMLVRVDIDGGVEGVEEQEREGYVSDRLALCLRHAMGASKLPPPGGGRGSALRVPIRFHAPRPPADADAGMRH